MNANYMMVMQMISLLLLIFLTGYFVLPHLPKRIVFTPFVLLVLFEKQQYEKNENLQIQDFSVFEKYQIWRFTERRKESLVLLQR